MDVFAAMQIGVAPALASALLHALWQNTMLGLFAAAAMWAGSRTTAALRHNVAMGFLVAMVAVPAWTFLQFWRQPTVELSGGWLPAITAPQLDAVAGGYLQNSTALPSVLALLWLVGVGAMLLRRFGGWRVLKALEQNSFHALPADWLRRVERLRAALAISRAVAVRVSVDVVSPFTARLLRPVIWLPLTLLTQLPREQLEALLAHELAHIARMDWLWNGLQCLIESLLFFHPAVWWLGRRIRQEREQACDDLAVAASGDAIALAEALAQLECRRSLNPGLLLAAHGGSLMKRISRLLNAPHSRSRWGTRAGLMVLAASGVLLVSQLGISGQGHAGIRIHSTTDGVPRPGDVREITTTGPGARRYYRGSIDPQGRLVEVYRQDGVARPIDAGVRRWVAEVTRLSVPPAPPLPPPPPPPPAPSDLALPPAPPPPPELADDAVFKSLLRELATDQGVIARLGSPVALASNDVHGRIDLDDGPTASGDVDMEFILSGPKGRSRVRVEAQIDDGKWSMDRVDFIGP